MTRSEFLREQTLSGANKCRRAPLPPLSVAEESCSLSERKALALTAVFDCMPIYIGERELIVGTRTLFSPNAGNEDGHDVFSYKLFTRVPYVTAEEVERFGCYQSYRNRTHYTPDFGIVLDQGIGGLFAEFLPDPLVLPHAVFLIVLLLAAVALLGPAAHALLLTKKPTDLWSAKAAVWSF